jgi:hypothetical protein
VDINSKVKTIHNVLFKLFEEISARKDWNITVDARNSCDKAIIVDTTHLAHCGFLSNFNINTGEDELKKIKDTGAIVTVAEIYENNITT